MIHLAIHELYRVLSNHQRGVLAVFFLGFFVLTAIAIAFQRRRYVRTGYLAVFFSILLFVNVTSLTLFPFMHWYKFSEPRGEELTSHLVKVVDSDGEELLIDARATPPLIGSSYYVLGYHVDRWYSHGTRRDERIRREVGRYLLSHVCSYRDRIERGPVPLTDRIDFPRHTLDYEWSRRELADYSEFTAIRVYEVEIRTSEDGSRVTSYTETRIAEMDPGNCSTLSASTGVA